jgi:hypothetical protein
MRPMMAHLTSYSALLTFYFTIILGKLMSNAIQICQYDLVAHVLY